MSSETDFYEDLEATVGCAFYHSFEVQPLNTSGCTSIVSIEGVGVFPEQLVNYTDGGQPVTQFNLTVTGAQLSLVNPTTGSPLAGTAMVANGSTGVAFTMPQTIPAGTALTFAAQPGVFYFLSAPITKATSAVLSTPYTGVSNAATVAGAVAPVTNGAAVTCQLTNGSTTVPTSTSAAGLISAGDTVLFSAQPTQPYDVAFVTTGALVLTSPYSGSPSSSSYAIDVGGDDMQAGLYPYIRRLTWPGTTPIPLPYGHGMFHLAAGL